MFSNDPLEVLDKELYDILKCEETRQKESINLIASENLINKSTRECLGSCLSNKYSEGYPHKRYYGGNDYIDMIEELCYKRALEAFGLKAEEWSVNVQPLSGSAANVAALYGLIGAGGKLLGMHLCSGGHLTHGYFSDERKVSITSVLFQSQLYKCGEDGYINYEVVREMALKFKPNVIICGYTCYPRDVDYKKFRDICDEVNAYLLADISHTSCLIATKILNSPFEYADVVTSTTHKVLRGPRSALIFCNKKRNPGLDTKIDQSVFPGFQGGPHNNKIAALACQLKEVNTDMFRDYAKQIVLNSKALAKILMDKGLKLITNGTDNHLILVDLRKFEVTGSKLQELCNAVNINLNKNTIPTDASCLTPSGVRIGTASLTTRGAKEKDMEAVADFLIKSINLTIEIQKKSGKKLADFKKELVNNPNIDKLKEEVVQWISKFPIP